MCGLIHEHDCIFEFTLESRTFVCQGVCVSLCACVYMKKTESVGLHSAPDVLLICR